MATNPAYKLAFNTIDQSSEPTHFSISLADVVALDPVPAGVTNLITALDTELVNWTPISYSETITRRLGNAAVGESNREDKVELQYHDAVTFKPYSVEVPCRKGTLATTPGTDLIPPATWATTKTTFEAIAKSPDGNAVVLDAVRLIGRNT